MRILVIDDDVGFLGLMEEVLRRKGYDVVTAPDGKQARTALEGETIDLILCDVFMPTLDGIRFHSFVREFTDARDVPFVFISAYDEEQVKKMAVESENDYFLRKPVPVEDILALIDRVIGTPSAGDA